ncbi:hypothetical protein [Amycolatopsis saalfeldensis]|nr:hypothetical protein [Amycolatopsis saalfeldensis]
MAAAKQIVRTPAARAFVERARLLVHLPGVASAPAAGTGTSR